ncbi:MAG: 50S ribosomal protein L1 [Gemmatimonadaceae bacterium]|nr:50S ribosomal protein L1 [Gemmatimonadaceae bacterium]
MRSHGKKFKAAAARINATQAYASRAALEAVKAGAFAKFDETVEVAVRLGVDPRHADQVVRGTVVLPEGTGKTMRVLVIANGPKIEEAEAAGADFVGVEYIQKIKDGFLDFDVMIATPDQMGQVGQLGRVLGPRGLMPNPKTGTVTFDVARAVKETKAGRIEFRVDKGGNVHVPIGKVSFTARERWSAELRGVHGSDGALEAQRSAKGVYVRTPRSR